MKNLSGYQEYSAYLLRNLKQLCLENVREKLSEYDEALNFYSEYFIFLCSL